MLGSQATAAGLLREGIHVRSAGPAQQHGLGLPASAAAGRCFAVCQPGLDATEAASNGSHGGELRSPLRPTCGPPMKSSSHSPGWPTSKSAPLWWSASMRAQLRPSWLMARPGRRRRPSTSPPPSPSCAAAEMEGSAEQSAFRLCSSPGAAARPLAAEVNARYEHASSGTIKKHH